MPIYTYRYKIILEMQMLSFVENAYGAKVYNIIDITAPTQGGQKSLSIRLIR